MMFAAPFNRILWKEYRVHRALWFSCLAIGIAVMYCIWWSTDDRVFRENQLTWVPCFFSLFFPLGCGAILFAAEREERTNEWLLALSAPPVRVLLAKLTFAILATLSLQWCYTVFASTLLVFTPAARFDVRFALLPVGLIVLIWTTLGSLLTRRVPVAIPIAAALAFAAFFSFVLAVDAFIPSNDPKSRSQIWITGISCLYFFIAPMCAIGVLGWYWGRGKYVDAAMVWGFAKSVVQSQTYRSLEETSICRIPSAIEREYSWQRSWQRLVWQERRREKLHLVFLALCCIWIVAASALVGTQYQADPEAVVLIPLSFFIFLLPGAIGILGFRCDTGFKEPQFLVNRGVSLQEFWLAKHYVWLPRAFWATGCAGLVLSLMLLYVDRRLLGIDARFPLAIGKSQNLMILCTRWAGTVFCYILLAYGSGQLAATLFRRDILAIAAAYLMNSLSLWWLTYIHFLQIPIWWALLLPVGMMLAVSLWQLHCTARDQRSRKDLALLTAIAILTPIAMFTLVAVYRVVEAYAFVPVLPLNEKHWNLAVKKHSLLIDAEGTFRDSFLAQQLKEFGKRDVKGNTTVSKTEIDQLVEHLNETLTLSNSNITRLSNQKIQNELNKNPTQSNTQQMPQANRLQVDPAMFDIHQHYYRTDLIIACANNDIDRQNDLERRIRFELARLRLARAVATNSGVLDWSVAVDRASNVIKTIRKLWDDHTPEETLFQDAVGQITTEVYKFPSLPDAFVSQYLIDRKVLERSYDVDDLGPIQRDFTKHTYHEPNTRWIMSLWRMPWERIRSARLLELSFQMQFQECYDQENQTVNTKTASIVLEAKKEFSRQLETSYLFDLGMPIDWEHSKFAHRELINSASSLRELILSKTTD